MVALRVSNRPRGISLIEVEKDLKIRKKYLQALKEGNIDIIPGRTYLIGYLRNYK
ncbi:helix-turn-helix domain-containing protein [bacterium]|nr:helix-turn-helix domain-containing protein [bacterium]